MVLLGEEGALFGLNIVSEKLKVFGLTFFVGKFLSLFASPSV